MFRIARPDEPHDSPPVRRLPPRTGSPAANATGSAYGSSFWFAYLANTTLMIASSLLFRYGDFVAMLGGTEMALGLIVGAGTIGSLTMRLAQGVGIDRYGARRIWLWSMVFVIITLLAHVLITRADTPAVFLVRIMYHSSLAGAYGASMAYISRRAPVVRMAELIGMLGSSGFVGMALGSQLGDLLCQEPTLDRWHVDRLFVVAAGLASVSLVFAWFATRGEIRPLRRKRPPMLWLIRRYHPGSMLMIGAAMGMGLGLPGTFLRPYTETLGIARIGTFFGVYAVTAFVARLATRRVPDRLGVRPSLLLGMGLLIASILLYLPIRAAWQLALPGVVVGIGHALLFPAVVAGGSSAFPARYRGLGTTLILGMFDVGNLIGMPLAGTIVDSAGRFGLAPYPTMFVSIAGLLTAASVVFALGSSKKQGTVRRLRKRAKSPAQRPERVPS